VLVTGASSGLGEHFARVLAGAGAQLVLAARRVAALERLAEALRESGASVHVVAMDVTDSASVRAGVDSAVAAAGGLSVLINNAGVTQTVPFLEQSEESWDHIIDTNLNGAWLVARRVAEHMAEHHVAPGESAGNIVNIASVLSFRVAGHLAAYCASKGAILQLTRAMALDLARHGIRVNALAPGYIETPFNEAFFKTDAGKRMISRIPQRRVGRGSDLDGALLLLASRASAYMAGSVVTVDGGHLQSPM
jgi:NAD(P)-dependent dehydrogenase (short-subunit alcohol dehydrogenase family)